MNVDIRWKLRRHQTFSSTSNGPRFTLKPGMNKVDAVVLAAVLAAGQDRPKGISSYINSGDLVVLGPDGEETKPPKGYGDPDVPLGLEVPPEGAYDDEDEGDDHGDDAGEDGASDVDDDSSMSEDGDPADGDESAPSAGDASDDTEGADSDDDDDLGIPEDLAEYTVPAAAEIIGETFDAPTLEKWAEAEENGEARVGIANALAEQLELVTVAGDDSTGG